MKIQSLKKLQAGGNITRRQARKASYDNFGYQPGAGHFDTAYTNAKNALRENGLRGKELRQTARSWFVRPSQTRDIVNQNLSVSNPLNIIGATLSNDVPLGYNDYYSKNTINNRRQDYIDALSFNDAFKFARATNGNQDGGIFTWRKGNNKENPSGLYTTNLARGPKMPIISDDIVIEEPLIDGLPDNYITEDMLTIPNINVNIPKYETYRGVSDINGRRQYPDKLRVSLGNGQYYYPGVGIDRTK